MKTLYDLLEVDKNATLEEIKKSYRLLAKKYHPDKNNGNSIFEEKFKKITNAYKTLSNNQTRIEYDIGLENIFQKKEESRRQKEKSKEKSSPSFTKKNVNRDLVDSNMSNYLFVIIIVFIILFNVIEHSRKKDSKSHLEQIVPSNKIELIDGEWTGIIEQYDINDKYSVNIKIDSETENYLVNYPELNCSGKLELGNIDNFYFYFNTILESGFENCLNDVKFKIQISNEILIILYMSTDNSKLIAKGILHRKTANTV